MKKLNIAIVGATGLVGRKIIEVLEERKIDANYHLFACSSGVGQKFSILGQTYAVKALNEDEVKSLSLDYAFFAVSGEVSKRLAPVFTRNKVVVIDNSNAFRRNKSVPLVVPQVNAEALSRAKYLISNPNCSTIQLVTALKPLDDKFRIKRVIVSTYQAVSGAGQKGILDYQNNTANKFDYPICSNLIPHIDVFLPNGYSREEDKLMFETRKILSRPDLEISATAVRVPVLNGHSESVNIEFERGATVQKLQKILSNSSNIILQDDVKHNIYPMPLYASGRDEVFVGRIRKDEHANCFNLWIVADNLRRGAASNAVDIFEAMERRK